LRFASEGRSAELSYILTEHIPHSECCPEAQLLPQFARGLLSLTGYSRVKNIASKLATLLSARLITLLNRNGAESSSIHTWKKALNGPINIQVEIKLTIIKQAEA